MFICQFVMLIPVFACFLENVISLFNIRHGQICCCNERDLCWQLAEFILLYNSTITVARHYSIVYTYRPTDLQ